MGLIHFLKGLFKNGKASDLLEQTQKKLQDGSLDGILNKVGINSDKAESIVGGAATAVGMAEKVLGRNDKAAEESNATDTKQDTTAPEE